MSAGGDASENLVYRKISHDDVEIQSRSYNTSSETAGGGGTKKTARISSPQEVMQQKRLARKTLINDDNEGEEGILIEGFKNASNTRHIMHKTANIGIEEELKEPLIKIGVDRETTIERI